MSFLSRVAQNEQRDCSPLVLSDRLLSLAEDADRAGFRIAAEHLLYLAEEVLDRPSNLTG